MISVPFSGRKVLHICYLCLFLMEALWGGLVYIGNKAIVELFEAFLNVSATTGSINNLVHLEHFKDQNAIFLTDSWVIANFIKRLINSSFVVGKGID